MSTYKYTLSIVFLLVFTTFHQAIAQDRLLSLEEAKSLALSNNKKIKKADKTIEAAKAAKSSVYASDKPFVEASGMGVHVGDPLNTLLPEFFANASLGVTQVIYAGGKINTAKQMSSTAVDLYTSQKELTDSEVLLNVETTYWQIINVKSKVELANKYKALLTELLKDLTNSYNAGIIYKNDVLRVQVQLNQAELDLTKAKDGLKLLKLKMAQLTGMPNIDFLVKDTISNNVILLDEVSQSTAIDNRPEIKMLKKAVEIEELQSKILEADRKPTIGLNVSGIYANGKQINFTDGSNDLTSYYGLLNVNIPIFDWGSRKKKVKEQEFKVEAQKLELEETEELLSLQIQNAYLELQQAIQKVEITEKSLQQADENLRLNQDRFDVGTVTGKDVLEAQVLWQQAYSDVIDAKANYRINEANYKKAIGDFK
ncbi:TolC family protein [Winogradskyella sp. SYSU M77433]|uniref:TolC family protein n=1 Tax=Winogradskyella sp. SYSU M77433 TaxID=3042722 RepID=UPI00247FAADB|nr:TolC family protein [Winogradskyella sp. SYSU M77433]MDH7912931.1 TolC family protein [Winogradskyella sp. SYSU M77433]